MLTIHRKVQLIALFSIGFILVAMTIARLGENLTTGALQINRTIWASVEAFAGAFVANTPTLYTLRKRTDPSLLYSNGRGPYASHVSHADRDRDRQLHGITVTRSVNLETRSIEMEERGEISKSSVHSMAGAGWDKQASVDDLIHVSPEKFG